MSDTHIESSQPAAAPIAYRRLVEALEMVEGGRWADPGGKLCIKRATWEEATRLPFWDASSKTRARVVAETILRGHAARMAADGITPTAHRLAVCWNRGYAGWRATQDQSNDYGERVANLYHE